MFVILVPYKNHYNWVKRADCQTSETTVILTREKGLAQRFETKEDAKTALQLTHKFHPKASIKSHE